MEEHKLDIVFRLSATFISTNIVPITAQTKQKKTKEKGFNSLQSLCPDVLVPFISDIHTFISKKIKKTVGVWSLVFLGRLTECKVHFV